MKNCLACHLTRDCVSPEFREMVFCPNMAYRSTPAENKKEEKMELCETCKWENEIGDCIEPEFLRLYSGTGENNCHRGSLWQPKPTSAKLGETTEGKFLEAIDKMMLSGGYEKRTFTLSSFTFEEYSLWIKDDTQIDEAGVSFIYTYARREALREGGKMNFEEFEAGKQAERERITNLLQELLKLSSEVKEPAIKIRMLNILEVLKHIPNIRLKEEGG